uniref:Prion protein, related sequence 3 n=1 Tax=Lates calcarifer TaxID=8187 RepID=A0A4W6C7W2_LATCA
MKLTSLSVLCLSLLLFHAHSSLAKRGGGGGFGRGFGSKSRGSTHTNTNTGHKSNQGSSSKGGYPKQPGQTSQGGYAPQPGRPGSPGGYPQQGGGGYHNQYPARGSPYGGGYGAALVTGATVLGVALPFPTQVQAMGMYPNDKSRGFGRSAVMAAAGGAVAGMALGYGLGRFPRPHFNFHSPQEEYYYNHYMYRRYGVKSTDTNDYSRDYVYSKPTQTYDSYMDSCMKRKDLLTAAEKSLTSAPSTPPSQASGNTEDDDTVSIVEIGYPALVEQLKVRKCLELYMVYSDRYLKKQSDLNDGVQGLEVGLRGFLAVVTSTVLMLLMH